MAPPEHLHGSCVQAVCQGRRRAWWQLERPLTPGTRQQHLLSPPILREQHLLSTPIPPFQNRAFSKGTLCLKEFMRFLLCCCCLFLLFLIVVPLFTCAFQLCPTCVHSSCVESQFFFPFWFPFWRLFQCSHLCL